MKSRCIKSKVLFQKSFKKQLLSIWAFILDVNKWIWATKAIFENFTFVLRLESCAMGATMNFSRTRPIIKKGRLKDEILVYMAIKSRQDNSGLIYGSAHEYLGKWFNDKCQFFSLSGWTPWCSLVSAWLVCHRSLNINQ